MVSSFAFAPIPHLIFGAGKIKELPRLIASFGKEVLILTGKASFTSSEHWQELQTALEQMDVTFHHAVISREPSPDRIDEICGKYHSHDLKLVVAIGGGSVLDAGKAVSAMLTESASVINFLEGVGTEKPSGTKLPFIAVPTTSGTGSETTKNAVMSTVGPEGFKKSLRHDNYIPNYALLDPTLTIHTPPSVTASSGMDAFTQLLEAFLSTKASPLTDALAWEGLMYVRDHLEDAWKNGESIQARSGMAYAAMLSGVVLANAGLGLVHGFASSVGGRIDIPHGALCGTLMGITNRITLKKVIAIQIDSPALGKYAKVGKYFSQQEGKSQTWYAEALLDHIDRWTELFSLPRLSAFGLTSNMIGEIVPKTSLKNHPVSLNSEGLSQILEHRS